MHRPKPSPAYRGWHGVSRDGCGGDQVRFIGLPGKRLHPTSVSPDGLPPCSSGMTATGSHVYFYSLRGAQPQGEGFRPARKIFLILPFLFTLHFSLFSNKKTASVFYGSRSFNATRCCKPGSVSTAIYLAPELLPRSSHLLGTAGPAFCPTTRCCSG